jgi:hypothetical protein
MTRASGPIRIIVLSLAVSISACGDESSLVSSPTSPSPPPPPVSRPTVAVAGVVTDSGRPVKNAGVGAAPLRWTALWSGRPREARSDASGRYQLTNLPQDPEVAYVRAYKDGYVQQCASAVTLQADASADMTLAEYANARIAGLPVAPNQRQLSGVVYGVIDGERRAPRGRRVGRLGVEHGLRRGRYAH